jgi:hypothetical protein
MKTMRILLLIGLAGLAIWAAVGADNGAVQKDLALLQGEWSMVSGSADGQDITTLPKWHMNPRFPISFLPSVTSLPFSSPGYPIGNPGFWSKEKRSPWPRRKMEIVAQ